MGYLYEIFWVILPICVGLLKVFMASKTPLFSQTVSW